MITINKDNFEQYKGELRIKTLEEFGGKRPCGWNSDGAMNYLFGKPLNKFEIEKFDSTDFRIKDNNSLWHLSYEDLIISPVAEQDKVMYKSGMDIDEYVEKLSKLKNLDETQKKWLDTYQRCVLDNDIKTGIKEALTVILNAHKFEEWGINKNFEKGITNSILLFGPPGTGKSMIAESIAAVLQKDLLRIDNSHIQSPIPGQTEKNIKKMFATARQQNAVVLLDECDSLLYNRNQVGAILGSEINCFLSEIERYDGIIVMTTNRIHKLDEALERRIVLKLEVKLPSEKARKQIWMNLIPKEMPVNKINYDALASLELSGGDIKNAILLSARKAITMNVDIVTHEFFEDAAVTVHESKKMFEKSRPRKVSEMLS